MPQLTEIKGNSFIFLQRHTCSIHEVAWPVAASMLVFLWPYERVPRLTQTGVKPLDSRHGHSICARELRRDAAAASRKFEGYLPVRLKAGGSGCRRVGVGVYTDVVKVLSSLSLRL